MPYPVCNKIRIIARAGFVGRVQPGKIYGSNTSPTADLVELVSLSSIVEGWNELTFSNTVGYKYLIYRITGNYGDVAELEFYNNNTLIGYVSKFGSPYFENNPAYDWHKPFDGNTGTFYVGESTGTNYFGIEVAEPDSTLPTGSVHSPAANQILRGTHIFKIQAQDNVAVKNVQLKIDNENVGSPVTTPTNGYYEISVDTNTLANGAHNVKALILDTSDNPYTTDAVNFSVDNLVPGGSITAPGEGQEISGIFEFSASATDLHSGVKNVKFFVDGVQQNTDPTSPYTLSKDTTQLSNSNHTVYAIIEDNAGNTYQTSTVTFSVYNVAPVPQVVPFAWSRRQIVPVKDMLFWHALDEEENASKVTDYSGHDRHLTVASNLPVLQADIINRNKAIYFDGTKNPLKFEDAINLKHLFLIAAFDGATFAGNEGLVSGVTAGSILRGNGAGTNKFANLGIGSSYIYRKNEVVFAESNQVAPIGAKFAIIELVFENGVALDGIQIGQDTNNTGRKWKGWFAEQIGYGEIKNWFERMQVYYYFACKFHQWRELSDGTKIFPFLNNHQSPFTPLRYKIQSQPLPNGKTKTRVKGSKLQSFEFNYTVRQQYEADAIDKFETELFDGRIIAVENNSFYPPRRYNIIPTTEISVDPASLNLFAYKWSGRQADTNVTIIDVTN